MGSRRGRFIGRKGQKECGVSIEMLDRKRHDVGLRWEVWLVLGEDMCRRATRSLEPWLPLLATLTSSVKRAGEAQDGEDLKMRRCEKAFRLDLRKEGAAAPFVRALNGFFFAANHCPEVPGRRCAKAAASA